MENILAENRAQGWADATRCPAGRLRDRIKAIRQALLDKRAVPAPSAEYRFKAELRYAATSHARRFSEDQSRDPDGKFASGSSEAGRAAGAASSKDEHERAAEHHEAEAAKSEKWSPRWTGHMTAADAHREAASSGDAKKGENANRLSRNLYERPKERSLPAPLLTDHELRRKAIILGWAIWKDGVIAADKSKRHVDDLISIVKRGGNPFEEKRTVKQMRCSSLTSSREDHEYGAEAHANIARRLCTEKRADGWAQKADAHFGASEAHRAAAKDPTPDNCGKAVVACQRSAVSEDTDE